MEAAVPDEQLGFVEQLDKLFEVTGRSLERLMEAQESLDRRLTALERSTVWIVQEQHALDGYVDDVLAVFSTEERARSFAADQPAEAGVDLHVFSAQLDPAPGR